VSFYSDYEALIGLYKIKIYILKNSKFRRNSTVIYSWLLTEIKMIRFIARGKKKTTTSLSPALSWSSLAPTTPIYDAPVNMHPRRTILYRGWLLLTAAWREWRQSLVPC